MASNGGFKSGQGASVLARGPEQWRERLLKGLVGFVVIGVGDARCATRLLQGQADKLLALVGVYELDAQ